MTAATMVKACPACGVERKVERATGRWSELLNQTDVLCDDCFDALEQAEERERAEQATAERRAARERAAALPAQLVAVDFDSLEVGANSEAFDAARCWATGDLDGLVLFGDVGRGKTTLAAAAAWQRLDLTTLRWTSVPALIAQAFGDDTARERAAATLTGTTGLILDDIDKVKAGDWVAAQLFTAIDSRITAGAPILVTTNLAVDEIAVELGRFGEAIASRLIGYCETQRVVGQDRRLEGAA